MNNINNDLISRQALCEYALNQKNKSVTPNDIMRFPSAQPERKVGKWIKDKSWSEGAGMGESYGHYWKCNQCNNIVKGDWSQCGDNFCSKCGADMRGEAK